MNIQIPEFSMIIMVGPSGSGKSTLARRLFQPTEIVSSDDCRAMVADNPNDQAATQGAFQVLHAILQARLQYMKLTVVDATNLEPRHRRNLLDIARENNCHTVAILMNTPRDVCSERNRQPGGRNTSESRLRHQHQMLQRSRRGLRKEGFRQVINISSAEESDELVLEQSRMRADLKDQEGPFDIIGDVHGCHDELTALLEKLGYENHEGVVQHPGGRRAIFLGDLVDRGPATDRVLELVINMTAAGSALCVAGNHENKLLRQMMGRNVQVTHGLAETLEQLDGRDKEFQKKVQGFLDALNPHYMLDGGKLAVTHAGIKAEYQGRASGRIRSFCLYGDTNGETDEWGLPVRQDWAASYQGNALVVYGHTPVAEPRFFNNTICIDTGCVFGGNLTALRYPERELVSVPADRVHYEPGKPLAEPSPPGEEEPEGPEQRRKERKLPDVEEMTGTHEVATRLMGRIRLEAKQLEPALELMSRFALDPRWLIYLPPTISPTDTSKLPGLLEHPLEAFQQYREDGVETVICEEKHMGSRGVVIIGRDSKAIRDQFGIQDDKGAACYSRTGRRFFNESIMEAEFFQKAREAIGAAGMWEELETGWLALDCEIMPWNLKAQRLIQSLYAPTGAAAVNTLTRTVEMLEQAAARGVNTNEIAERAVERLHAANSYREAYRPYCWSAETLTEVRAAPFHVLAAEGRTFADKPHTWHLEMGRRLQKAAPGLFQETRHQVVRLDNREDQDEATNWWESMTMQGGEGMVVKPMDYIPRGKREHIQPAVKVRGPGYLSIIYGLEYRLEGNLERMRGRGLRTKRRLALREFALAQEGLERFVDGESLARVHECAFGVLTLETEPTDPRL